MSNENKTHYRKAFNSPYLSSADIVGNTILTVERVILEKDKSKKTKDSFNTLYFVEKQLRQGEPLKPMILNACNSKTMRELTGSHYIDDWCNLPITVYVDPNVRFGRETVEGLRISPQHPIMRKQTLTPDNEKLWSGAITACVRDGFKLDNVLKKMYISDEHQKLIIEQANAQV